MKANFIIKFWVDKILIITLGDFVLTQGAIFLPKSEIWTYLKFFENLKSSPISRCFGSKPSKLGGKLPI